MTAAARLLPGKQTLWAWYIVVLGGLLAAYLFVPPFKGYAIVVNVIGVSSLLAIATGIAIHRPKARLAWSLLLVGQTLYVAGDFYTYTYPDLLGGTARYVDIWKTGWGTAYLDERIADKLAVLADHDVASCLGGTLLEIAWAQGAAEACLARADDAGFTHVEVSRGTVPMALDAKHELVRRAADRFVVLTEVGAKDPAQQHTLAQWGDEAGRDRDAGAALVVAEGRQSGTVGIYDADGTVREDVVAEIVDAVGLGRVVFEAPRAALRRAVPSVRVAGEGHDADRDPAVAAAHLPSVAWRTAKEALERGPVLVQVPRRGYLPSLSCHDCRRPARCTVCAGPLGLPGPQGPPACRWCRPPSPASRSSWSAAPTVSWSTPRTQQGWPTPCSAC